MHIDYQDHLIIYVENVLAASLTHLIRICSWLLDLLVRVMLYETFPAVSRCRIQI